MMKKSLFLLTIATVFVAWAVQEANAQDLTGTVACPTPEAVDVTCLGADALHPVAGTPYTYKVSVTPTGGTFHWIVTQDKNFITNGSLSATVEDGNGAGDYVLATGTGYNDAASTADEIEITWKSFAYDSANPLFVVIQATAPTDAGCNTNNIKVYKIEPKDAFTLDIANIETTKETSGDYTAGTVSKADVSSCVSDVASANYDVATEQMVYDYGTNHLFFAVTAANFSTSWKPTFKLTGVATGEEAKVEYRRSSDTDWTTATLNGTDTYEGTAVEVADASGTVGTAGECIIVRVTVAHNKVETLDDQTITLAVDGETQLASATPVKDIHHADCTDDNFDNDVANHVLKARPTVTNGTTGGDFIEAQP